MEKDPSILRFIEHLKTIIDFNLVQIVDYWDADLCAIGFKRDNKMVYVSTWKYVDEKILLYDYDLEILDEVTKDNINVIKEGRGVSEEEMISELRMFLDV